MLFDFNLYSCLLLLFFFHIIIYTFLFFTRSYKRGNYADKLMGWFLLVAGLIVVPFMLGFAGWYDAQPYRDVLFYLPIINGLAVGPLLYFYTRSIVNYDFRIKGMAWLHLLPAITYFAINIVLGLIEVLYFKRYNLGNEYTDPDFADWYTWLSVLSVLFYLFLSIRHYNSYKKYATIVTSFADQVSLKWLQNFLYAFALLSIMPIIKSIFTNFTFFERLRYFGPWYYYVAFAIVVYYIAINAYHAIQLPMHKIRFEPALLIDFNQPIPVEEPRSEQQIEAGIDPKELLVKNELTLLMEGEKWYERPDLTLNEVAKRLNTNAVVLSRVVNQQFGLNFNDYINQYRVNAIITMLTLPEFKNQTLLAIAYAAGFNSKATFNRAFKKFTQKNPKDFLV